MKIRIIVALVACILFAPGLLKAEQIEIDGIKGEMRSLHNGATIFVPEGWELLSEDWDGWKEEEGDNYDPDFSYMRLFVNNEDCADISLEPTPSSQKGNFFSFDYLRKNIVKIVEMYRAGNIAEAPPHANILECKASYIMNNDNAVILLTDLTQWDDIEISPLQQRLTFSKTAFLFNSKTARFMLVAYCPSNMKQKYEHVFDIIIKSLILPNR